VVIVVLMNMVVILDNADGTIPSTHTTLHYLPTLFLAIVIVPGITMMAGMIV
jgi:hypothetical protein